MSDTQRETLSAFVDGELSVEEARFLLRRMDHDVELCATWSRYHLIRDGLRQQMPPLSGNAFADGVFAAIGESAPTSNRRRWLQWSGGGVIAAGVAAMALIAMQPGSPVPNTPAQQSANRIAAVVSKPDSNSLPMTAPSVPRWLSMTPSAGQMAQPAAATFYSPGPSAGMSSQSTLAPYMSIHGYRATARRATAARAAGYPMMAMPQSSALPMRARAQ